MTVPVLISITGTTNIRNQMTNMFIAFKAGGFTSIHINDVNKSHLEMHQQFSDIPAVMTGLEIKTKTRPRPNATETKLKWS